MKSTVHKQYRAYPDLSSVYLYSHSYVLMYYLTRISFNYCQFYITYEQPFLTAISYVSYKPFANRQKSFYYRHGKNGKNVEKNDFAIFEILSP